MGRSWGVLGEGASRDLIMTVGIMTPGYIRRVTISGFVVPLFQSGCYCYARNISATLMLGLQYKYKHYKCRICLAVSLLLC